MVILSPCNQDQISSQAKDLVHFCQKVCGPEERGFVCDVAALGDNVFT